MQTQTPPTTVDTHSQHMGQVILLVIAEAILMLGYGAVMPILLLYLTIFGGGAFEYGLQFSQLPAALL